MWLDRREVAKEREDTFVLMERNLTKKRFNLTRDTRGSSGQGRHRYEINLERLGGRLGVGGGGGGG